jgi:hypothetical protein
LPKAQADEHFLGFGADLRIVQRVVLNVRLVVFGRGDGAGGFEVTQFLFEDRKRGAAGGDVDDSFVADRFGFLRQIADHRPFIALNDASVWNLLAEDNREQRRFAGAIRSDQRDAVTMSDIKRGVFEQSSSADRHF